MSHATLSYGEFVQEGSQYLIDTPKTPDTWYNYLFNDDYYMKISQTGQGDSYCLTPVERIFTRGYRFFYLLDHDTGICWNPNACPLPTAPEKYHCLHALGWSRMTSSYQGIEAHITAFVPLQGVQEFWQIRLKNATGKEKALSLFSVFSFECGRIMGTRCFYDVDVRILASFTYPHHQRYEDGEKLMRNNSYVYMFSDREPLTVECSERRFFGGDDLSAVPAAVANDRCSGAPAEWDYPAGAFQHRFILPPSSTDLITLAIGCANSLPEIAFIKKIEACPEYFQVEFSKVKRYWEIISRKIVVNTPDENLNHFVNHWLKKQLIAQTRCHRGSSLVPVRNELQDAMGYAMIDGQGAEEYMLRVLRGQEANGFLQQWHVIDNRYPASGIASISTMKHMDAPAWLVICVCALVRQTGDISFLDKKVKFSDNEETITIYEHLIRAIDYLSSATGRHELCLMGDGDWTDPLNGPGRLGRGESVWTTMALRYAILQFLPFCRRREDTVQVERLRVLLQRTEKAVNASCWDGRWYLGGFDDDGRPFGGADDQEARVFLNAQTWAVMSDIAHGDRLQKCLEIVDSLETACGPVLLRPALTGWNPRLGKISLKLAGSTENGSVYCHASMFKAYADCLLGRGGKAYETIRRTLPTNPENPPQSNLQIPIFVPNFYFGLEDSPNFGRSSQKNKTGTAPWMLWVTVEYLLGIRATEHGLLIDPCVPAEWTEFSIERDYKKARYSIHIKKPAGIEKGTVSIIVDGLAIEGTLLPYQDGGFYQVEVTMGGEAAPAKAGATATKAHSCVLPEADESS